MMCSKQLRIMSFMSFFVILISVDVCRCRPHGITAGIIQAKQIHKRIDKENVTGLLVPVNPRCKFATICDASEIDYPQEIAVKAMTKFRENIKAALKSNGIEMKEPDMLSGLITRRGTSSVSKLIRNIDVDDEELCPSKETRLTAVAARNVHNEWRYLINDDIYEQTTIFYACRRPGESCHPDMELPRGQRTVCRQMTTQIPLIALDPFSHEVITDVFRIPSICSCSILQEVHPTKGNNTTTGASK